jgi:hypothetical protein
MCRRGAADRRRSCAHPVVAPSPSSHYETAQNGIAVSGWSRRPGESNCSNGWKKATCRATDGNQSPQGGVTPRLRSSQEVASGTVMFRLSSGGS